MALALLELESLGHGSARFRIDTGSNRYYQLKLGRGVRQNGGVDWVDGIFFSTPIGSNPAGGSLLDSRHEVSLPLNGLDRGNVYAQLFSFKTADGKSPGFSTVLALGAGANAMAPIPDKFSLPSSRSTDMTPLAFAPVRRIPCRTGAEALAQQTSIEELLGGIAKVAMPIISGLINGAGRSATPVSQGAGAAASPGAAPAAAGSAAAPAVQSEDLGKLLNMILAAVGGGSNTSQGQSLLAGPDRGNRFSAAQSVAVSRAMVAGIDDAAMLAFIGPLIDGVVKVLPGVVGPIAQNAPQMMRELNQHLPMLINSINQKQIQQKAADNKMATDMLSDVNRRMILEQFMRSQPAPSQGAAPGADLAALGKLIELLQQSAAATTATTNAPAGDGSVPPVAAAAAAAAAPAPVAAAVAHSLSLAADDTMAPAPSRRASLAFALADGQLWNGSEHRLFTRDRGLQFTLRLNVTAPAPSQPLPKAILKLVFKNPAQGTVLLEKSFRQKDWAPNSALPFAFAADELSSLPLNQPLKLLAELRWPGANGAPVSSALGSCEIVLVGKYFVKQQGAAAAPERELRDMNRFRAFWNKVWEAPVLDEAGSRRERSGQVLWSLDVNAKYTVLLSAEHEANGLMETRLLKEKVDPDDISARTSGRLKAGIELSIAELNKLLPLWDAPSLERDKLEAFLTRPLAQANAMEFIYNMKLGGKAGQRGLVWVVPVFQLFEFTLGSVGEVGDSGQVTTVTEEKVKFPLPVAARVIGLRSEH